MSSAIHQSVILLDIVQTSRAKLWDILRCQMLLLIAATHGWKVLPEFAGTVARLAYLIFLAVCLHVGVEQLWWDESGPRVTEPAECAQFSPTPPHGLHSLHKLWKMSVRASLPLSFQKSALPTWAQDFNATVCQPAVTSGCNSSYSEESSSSSFELAPNSHSSFFAPHI